MRLAFALFAFVGLLGCSGPVAVEGNVTWEKTPIADGTIRFAPVDGSAGGATAKISAGRYALKAPAGDYKVEIYAMRAGAKVDAVMGAAPLEQFLPDRFNRTTVLTTKVGAGLGPNDFHLSAKP